MVQIRWDNVNANLPSLADSYARFGEGIQQAIAGLKTAAADYQAKREDNTLNVLKSRLAGYTDSAAYKRDVASGALTQGLNPSLLTGQAYDAISGLFDTLQSRELRADSLLTSAANRKHTEASTDKVLSQTFSREDELQKLLADIENTKSATELNKVNARLNESQILTPEQAAELRNAELLLKQTQARTGQYNLDMARNAYEDTQAIAAGQAQLAGATSLPTAQAILNKMAQSGSISPAAINTLQDLIYSKYGNPVYAPQTSVGDLLDPYAPVTDTFVPPNYGMGGKSSPDSFSGLIANNEAGRGGYGAYNQGRAGDALGKSKDFSQMTVGQLMELQRLPKTDPNYVHAFGKYQMIPSTFKEGVKKLGISADEKVTPELQERLFTDYLTKSKRPDIYDYVTGNASRTSALAAASKEWAALADPSTGRSFYDGDSGGNKASVSSEQVGKALDAAKASYTKAIAAGVSPEEAWRQAIRGMQPSKPSQPKEPTSPTPEEAALVTRGRALDANAATNKALYEKIIANALPEEELLKKIQASFPEGTAVTGAKVGQILGEYLGAEPDDVNDFAAYIDHVSKATGEKDLQKVAAALAANSGYASMWDTLTSWGDHATQGDIKLNLAGAIASLQNSRGVAGDTRAAKQAQLQTVLTTANQATEAMQNALAKVNEAKGLVASGNAPSEYLAHAQKAYINAVRQADTANNLAAQMIALTQANQAKK